MACRIAELRHKEVINESDGARLGCVDDVEIDTKTACLVAIVIYGRPKLFGLLGRHDDFVIPWG
ncbi:MAG: YlmC/YmxH family sporulation protein, partial [Clostridia bacterium]|nr:YlmC/YmxH family sporulation protein [Clostridia bacterium]